MLFGPNRFLPFFPLSLSTLCSFCVLPLVFFMCGTFHTRQQVDHMFDSWSPTYIFYSGLSLSCFLCCKLQICSVKVSGGRFSTRFARRSRLDLRWYGWVKSTAFWLRLSSCYKKRVMPNLNSEPLFVWSYWISSEKKYKPDQQTEREDCWR